MTTATYEQELASALSANGRRLVLDAATNPYRVVQGSTRGAKRLVDLGILRTLPGCNGTRFYYITRVGTKVARELGCAC